ncbi:BadF/BadG/BcrA/BcrD ATPase family protein [Cohaesibacter gelatinilyticus]|nr:BadF/BadG/BcrA/BcrD ATPase family protein [Cohaesibacter gelatinilyticus]
MSMNQKDEEAMATASYILGIDGGGTNCRGRLRDTNGQILGEAMGGPANTRLGVAAAHEQVLMVCIETLKAASLISSDCKPDDDEVNVALGQTRLGVGLAGLHLESQLDDFLNWDHSFASLEACNDAHIACLGAHDGEVEGKGILILGTGSCGYGFKDGSPVNIGGWGFKISDMSSGAVTGYLAVRHALAVLDQIYPSTGLSEEILQHFSHDAETLVLWSDKARPTDYGQFTKLVVHHANEGDEAALDLMRTCGRQTEAMLGAMKTRGIEAVSLVGGFAEHVEPYLRSEMKKMLVPRFHDARDGAILLAGGVIGQPSMLKHEDATGE